MIPFRSGLVCVLLVLTAGTGAAAQDQDRIDLATWDQAVAYRGWRAQEFLDAVVYGKNAERLGEVLNFYIDREGQVTKVIIESGGIFDIGDVHLSVPWGDVTTWLSETDGIVVPIDNDNIADFSLFREDPSPGVAEWRATDLIDDHVYLADDRGFGIVDDFIFDLDGQIQAIIVQPDLGQQKRDPVAYPWFGLKHDPLAERVDLMVEQREIEVLGPFDYDALNLDGGRTPIDRAD